MSFMRNWFNKKVEESEPSTTELPLYPNCKLTSRIVDHNAEHVTITFWMNGQHIGRLVFKTDNFMDELAAFTNMFTDDPWEAVGNREEVEKMLAEHGY